MKILEAHGTRLRSLVSIVIPTMAVALSVTGGAHAQFARTPIIVSTAGGDADVPRVASSGDVTAVVYVDDMDSTVRLVTSDGRGVEWSAPIRVDADLTGAPKVLSDTSVDVLNDQVFVSWLDLRNGSKHADVFMNVYDVSSGQWSGEQWVDKGYPQGNGSVSDWAMAVSSDASGSHAHFLVMSSGLDPFVTINDLWFTSTSDYGVTFRTPRNLTPDGAEVDPFRFDLAAVGSVVHLGWADNRADIHFQQQGREVFYQRSDDSGATFQPLDTPMDLSGPAVGAVDLHLDLEASATTVAVSWIEYTPSVSGSDRLRVNVSPDGGVTWSGDRQVGQYSLNDTWIHEPHLTVEPDSGTVVVAWADYRGGTPLSVSPQAFAAVTGDGGLTWAPDSPLSPSGATHVRSVHTSGAALDGNTDVTVTWTDYSTGFFTGSMASHSRDGGLTWDPPVRISDDLAAPRVAHNARYDNFIAAWVGSGPNGSQPHEVYVGGFRPQSVTPLAWFPGSTHARFVFTGFDGQSSFGAVLLSFAPGSLPIPDGRDLGLTADLLFASAAPLISTTAFSTVLDGLGSGATSSLSLNVPSGLTLYVAGISASPSGVDQLTDVVPIVIE